MLPSTVRGFITVFVVVTLGVVGTAECPPGWMRQDFKCVRLFEEPSTWKEAEDRCRSFADSTGQPGHLLSVFDVKEGALLSWWDLAVDRLWVGLARHDGEDLKEWSNGLPADPYLFIEDGMLNTSADGDCVSATVGCHQQPSRLVMTECDTNLYYMCEISICPTEWTLYAGKCYQYFDDNKTWNEAERHCQETLADGVLGHLVSMRTQQEISFLQELQKDRINYRDVGVVWIGLYGFKNGTQTSWIGEHGNSNDQLSLPESCYRLYGGMLGKADDCSGASPFVCQLSTCPVGLVAFQGDCLLYIGETPDTSDLAPSFNTTRDRPDGSPPNRKRRAFSFDAFKRKKPEQSTRSKTAIQSGFKFSNLWQTSKKSNIKSVPKSSGSGKSSFSGFSFRRNRFTAASSAGKTGKKASPFSFGAKLNLPVRASLPKAILPKTKTQPVVPLSDSYAPPTTVVTVRRGRVTTQSVVPTNTIRCPSKWIPLGSSCILYSTVEMSWDDAETYCSSIDLGVEFPYQSHLPTVENVEQNAELVEDVQRQAAPPPAWIGKRKISGRHEWVVDETTTFNSFLDPHGDEAEDCVYLNFKTNFNWGHKACAEKLPFFCKFKQTVKYARKDEPVAVSSVRTAGVPTGTKKCFVSWTRFGDYCYYFFTQSLTWRAASIDCEKYVYGNVAHEKASLVSVTSPEENDFLAGVALPGSIVWVGLNVNSRWLDGSTANYRPSEIDPVDETTDLCSYLENKQLGKADCKLKKFRYVCKMPAAVVDHTVRKKRQIMIN